MPSPCRLAVALASTIGLAAGCVADDGAAATDDAMGAVLLGTFDPNRFCDMVGVVTIELTATRVGCVPGPPAPCTLPADPVPISGDRASCPVTDPSISLGVDITEPGRYRLEAVAESTAGDAIRRCFAVGADPGPGLVAGQIDIEVDEVAIEDRTRFRLVATDAACP